MSLYRMFDASTPTTGPVPGCQAAGGYLGAPGRTPHIWTAPEWNQSTANGRLRMLPYWLPNYDETPLWNAQAAAAAAMALGWQAHAAQRRVIGLDMETNIDPAFVIRFDTALRALGFATGVYGSEATVTENPPCFGYLIAAYPGAGPVLEPGIPRELLHQYAADIQTAQGLVDLSVFTQMLWDRLGRGPRHG